MKNPAWGAFALFLFPFTAPGGEMPTELLPPRGELPPSWWEQHGWLAVLAGLAALIVIALLIACLSRRKPPVMTPPETLTRRELAALRGSTEDGALLVKVSGILRHYVLYVCGLPPAELTTAELREAIASCPQLGPDLAAAINEFFRQCDERKFSPAPPEAALGAFGTALALVDKIELHRQSATVAPSPHAVATT